jgi:hypothetical protein
MTGDCPANTLHYIRTAVPRVDFVLGNLNTVNPKLEWFKARDAKTVQQLQQEFN